MKFLLIDDSEIELYVTSRLLDNAGISTSVLTFLEARDALSHLNEVKMEKQNLPDVILLDIHMPTMSGFDFLDHYIQSLGEMLDGHISIIILSSTADQKDFERAKNYKIVKGVFDKPLDTLKLKNLLEEINT